MLDKECLIPQTRGGSSKKWKGGSHRSRQFVPAFPVRSARAQVSYPTQHNDNMRTGDNLSETILNQSNGNMSTCKTLFKVTVDDQVYAIPL